MAWLVVAALVAAACAGPVAELAPPGPAGGATRPVWVIDHGWHTAIVVRRADVDRARWTEVDDFLTAALVEIAWGDREFYMAADPTAWMAIKAALAAGASVLHVAGLERAITEHFPQSEVVELRVSASGLDALTRFFADEHQRDAAGRSRRLQRGLYGPSWFYAARSTYSLANTCNTWVARALQTAGLPVTPSGVVTSGGVMEQVRRAHRTTGY